MTKKSNPKVEATVQVLGSTDFADELRSIVIEVIPTINPDRADEIGDKIADVLLDGSERNSALARRLRSALSTELVPGGDYPEMNTRLIRAFNRLPGGSMLFNFPRERRMNLNDIVEALETYALRAEEIMRRYEEDRAALNKLRQQRAAIGNFLQTALKYANPEE